MIGVRWMMGIGALAAVTLGAGCGSDSGDSGDTTSTATTDTTTSTAGGDTDTQVESDTAAPSETSQTDDTTGSEVATGVDTVVDDAADDTAVADTSPPDDTSTDDGDAAAPACTLDEHCLSPTAIAPPNACAARPRCIDGACVVAPPDCDDGDPCTLDACDPRMGCVNFEQVQDIGSSRIWYCPGPITGDAAGTACAARGADFAQVVTAEEALAWTVVLADHGAPDAWVSPFSSSFCKQDKRVIIPPCQTLDADGCTVTAACTEERAFLCQIFCNDGDPCTRDFVGPDGLCQTEPETCDDGDLCTTDACDPDDGCVHTRPAAQCDDGVPCTTDSCDPASGECRNQIVKQVWDATHQLLACPGPLTWSAARTRCAVEGAVLAMPTTDAHRGLLDAIAASAGATGALWAPLKQQDGGNQPWDWTDGGGSGAPPWCASVQPNFSEAGYCGAWSTDDTCLLDVPCTEVRSFGCVIDTSVP